MKFPSIKKKKKVTKEIKKRVGRFVTEYARSYIATHTESGESQSEDEDVTE